MDEAELQPDICDYILVESPADLLKVCRELTTEKRLGVDMEADSLFHYPERVCLIQISSESSNYIIDPLLVKDLSCLSPLFSDPGVVKIFHGADYDIRSLKRDFQFEVNSLFDTQIAARFLNSRELSLAGLLKERMGLVVEKRFQKKDWSRRPLPKEMLSYGAGDTCHLIGLAEMLERELRSKDRLAWVREECRILSSVRFDPDNGEPLFYRFRGAGRLDRRGLAVLEYLLRYRKKEAIRRNIPPFKVLENSTLMGIAQSKPGSINELKLMKGLGGKRMDHHGTSLLAGVRKALELPEDGLPILPPRKREHLSSQVSALIRKIRKWRDQKAMALDIDPPTLCPNGLIKSIAVSRAASPGDLGNIPGIRKWQIRLFGKEVCSLISEGSAD